MQHPKILCMRRMCITLYDFVLISLGLSAIPRSQPVGFAQVPDWVSHKTIESQYHTASQIKFRKSYNTENLISNIHKSYSYSHTRIYKYIHIHNHTCSPI